MRHFIGLTFVFVSLAMLVISCGGGNSSSNVGDDVGDKVVEIKPPKSPLLSAIDQDKANLVQQHMNAGTDPNEYKSAMGFVVVHLQQWGAEGTYPLQLAVLKNNQEIVKLLLDNGANIDIKTKKVTTRGGTSNEVGFTSLHWAAYFCMKDMVSFLIQSGASINELDANNATPLDILLLGEETGTNIREAQLEDPSKYSHGADQLTPGCVGKVELDDTVKTQLWEDLKGIFDANGGQYGKDLG